MRAQWRLGRIAGIPIGLNWSVLAVFALFTYLLADSILPATIGGYPGAAYWLTGTLVACLFFAALLLHELGHALLARRYGVTVKGITLWMLGGVTELSDEPPTAGRHLAVAVAGPVTSLLAGALFGGIAYLAALAGGPRLATSGLIWLAATNGFLAVFNLLPGAPLDGGRVLQSLLWLRTGDRNRATAAAARAGRGLGMLMIGVGVVGALFTGLFVDGLWLMLIGWFVLSASAAEERMAGLSWALRGPTVGDVMDRDVAPLPAYLSVAAALARVTDQRREFYPVIDLPDRLLGLVAVDAMLRLPADRRSHHRVGQLTVPLRVLPTATPDEPLDRLIARMGDAQAVPVVEGDRCLGLLTREDARWAALSRALEAGRVATPA